MSQPASPAVDGLVIVDKPAGWTSHDVVARVRRLGGTRRVGHAGTLDPMATGVLVIAIGRATRLLSHLPLEPKGYDATIRFGQVSDTDDAEGEVTAGADASALTVDDVRRAVAALTGEIDQVPSTVSAIKVAGQRAYQRARRGEEFALAPRRVTVSQFDVRAVRGAGALLDADVAVTCSSGTYVRALARDAGSALGVGAHLTSLRRTRVGPYLVGAAHSLDELAEELRVLDLATVASQSFPTVTVDEVQAMAVGSGQRLAGLDLPSRGPVAVLGPDGAFLALYVRLDDSDGPNPIAKPLAVFAAH